MGGDFTYQDAFMWFDNLDKLIKHANLKAAKDGLKVKLFYSTPACYLKAVKDANPILPIKQDDFFPYASDPTAYWTGYFTSRPTTKFMEREGNHYLQTFKMLQVLADLPKTNEFVLNELKSAMGVMQHHDAITGTEKQHVAHDYERIMAQAVGDAFLISSQAFNKIMKTEEALEYQRCEFNQSQCSVTEESDAFVLTVFNNQAMTKDSIIVEIPVVNATYTVYNKSGDVILSELQKLPPDYFSIPTRQSKATHRLNFIVNDLLPLGFESFYIKKENRVKREVNKKIYDYYLDTNEYWKNIKDKTEVEIQTDTKLRKANDYIPERDNKINEEERDYDKNLNWDVLKDGEVKLKVKGGRNLGDETVKVLKDEQKVVFPSFNGDEMRMLADDAMVVEQPEDIILENEHISLSINKRTGWINYTSKKDEISLLYHPTPGYYIGCKANWAPYERASGAYIFRPNMTASPDLITFKNIEVVDVVQSNIKQEVTLRYDGVVTLIIGLNSDVTYFSSILSINEDTEHVLRFSTNLETNGAFFTDSNGRQMLKRIKDERPQWNLTLKEPIPGNYYPIVNEIYIEDHDWRVILNVDRARGGASLKDGSLEVMRHRRLPTDDEFGVGEALNETAGDKGLFSIDTVYLQIVVKDSFNLLNAIELSHALFSPPQLFVANANSLTLDKFKKMTTKYSFLKTELPIGVHLLSLEPWSDNKVLIRLENYLDKNTWPVYMIVDISKIFTTIEILSIKDTTLAANVWLSDFSKLSWNVEEEFSESFNLEYGGERIGRAREFDKLEDDGYVIKLKPKQIRTFIAEYRVVG